jgi:hypothetical protein
MTSSVSPHTIKRRTVPGFLTAPLGWVIGRLGDALEIEPALLSPLLALNKYRMHLVALALAHLPDEVTAEVATVLLQNPDKEVLEFSLGSIPTGIYRVLSHLPGSVISLNGYRKLVLLLTDRAIAKFLHHRSSIDEGMIIGLSRLPPVLRHPPVLALFERNEGMNRLVDGLRCLAERANLSFEALADQIGAVHQTKQVIAKIVFLAESLPPLEALPPAQIGPYCRLDSVTEIRSLAKEWQNCLMGCVHDVINGTSVVYRTDPPQQPAAAFVYRQWRLGWFLEQAKGPKNLNLEPEFLALTYRTFADADILQCSAIEAIKRIILSQEWARRRR